ncbi:putative amidohydrolase 2 [Ilyonectria robusta]
MLELSWPMPPLITLEEHFVSADLLPELSDIYAEQLKHLPDVAARLTDLGPLRLADMDANRVSLQVVSHAPGLGPRPPRFSALANDQLARAIQASPGRLAGLAVLPMAEPEAAAKELRRCVNELGFVGALVDAHVDGLHYDDRRFWPVFMAAAELDVPIYLHPTYPAQPQRSGYEGQYEAGAARSLGSSGFGWHQETGLGVLKLYAAGLFDEVPTLKIVVGHFGEMLPFMLERVEKLSVRWGNQQRRWRQVWDENIWITTSGVWSIAPMACILRNTRVDHILYSVDYPFEKNEQGLRWIRELQESGLVTPDELDMIAYRNAEQLLRVKATTTEGPGGREENPEKEGPVSV